MTKIDIHVLTAIIGITGMGKSYWTKQKLIGAIAKEQPVIIFDKDSEYSGPNAKDVPKGAGWKSFESIHSFMMEVHKTGFIDGVNVISCNKESDYDYGIKLIYSMDLPVCILLEEAHFIFDEPKLSEVQTILKRIARFGRKKNISLALVTQRFMDIPKDIRTQLRGVISFHQNDSADVESLKKFDSEAAKKIVAFQPREFEIFGELPNQIKNSL